MLLSAATLIVTSCATVTGGSFCAIYEPVFTEDGTPESVQRQIDRNNIAYCRLCDPDCPL